MEQFTCIWPRCLNVRDDDELPICDDHAREVFAHMQKRYRQAAASSPAAAPAPERARPAEVDGSVYYLLVGSVVKVGWTSNMPTRMLTYPPNSVLLAVEPGTRALEAQRHIELRQDRSHGREWFHRSPRVDAQIASVVAAHGEPKPLHLPHSRRKKREKPRDFPVTVTRIGG